jgi:hypothetical protein
LNGTAVATFSRESAARSVNSVASPRNALEETNRLDLSGTTRPRAALLCSLLLLLAAVWFDRRR